ncbi:putative odorant receptor 85d [Photinus pyralis]|uniref:putative odorant receptor 85d n=1 Tax=Photinus pyralis TaxID=7054 RepID=UPI001266F525|nr:putative odorant receptor 85d [Photinus pyralis]
MDDKEVKSHLNAILTKVVTIFVAIPPIAVGSGVVAWYTSYGEGTLPFGSMPRWAMEYSTNMCLVIQVITYTFLGHEFLMWDGAKWSILLQLRGNFKYLNRNARNCLGYARIDCEQSSNSTLNISWCHMQKLIKYIAVRHNYLSLATKEVELVFNKTVLISILDLSIIFCIILLRLSKFSSINMEACTLLFYLMVLLTLLCGDTFLCVQVVTESERLLYSYYEIDFVGTDLRFQKALVLLMTRAQRPTNFTIGNFAPLSMGAIVTVLKASISYLMLLMQIKDR